MSPLPAMSCGPKFVPFYFRLTLCRQWADELGTRAGMEGTTFNSVSVGFTKTEAYNKIPSEIREKLTASDAADVAVANRIGEVKDVADVVGLLVSEKARVSAECPKTSVFANEN